MCNHRCVCEVGAEVGDKLLELRAQGPRDGVLDDLVCGCLPHRLDGDAR